MVQPGARFPIGGRLIVLAGISAIGGVLFIPFLAAGSGQPVSQLIGFAAMVTIIATLVAWPGLRCADAVALPMPYLRRLDGGDEEGVGQRAIAVTLALSVGLGVLATIALRVVNAPLLPGSTLARALSTFFAAGPLEIGLHLGVMSVAVRLARGHRWPGILAAALALVLFHLSGGGAAQSTPLLVASIIGNGAMGLALGWVYAAYGFELTMLGHAVAHLLVVVAG